MVARANGAVNFEKIGLWIEAIVIDKDQNIFTISEVIPDRNIPSADTGASDLIRIQNHREVGEFVKLA